MINWLNLGIKWDCVDTVRFRHVSSKLDQFLTLKVTEFSNTCLKLLSYVCFNYLEPSITLWDGTRDLVCRNVWPLLVGQDFRLFFAKNDQFLILNIPKFSNSLKLVYILFFYVCFNYLEPSVAIMYGMREIVCLNEQFWDDRLDFR